VVRTRKGDCTEHAVLLVALARAAGIPARTVSGFVYVSTLGRTQDVLGGHQWAQLYVHGQWVDFDAAIPGDPATVCRVAVAFGAADGKTNPKDSAAFLQLSTNLKSAQADKVVEK